MSTRARLRRRLRRNGGLSRREFLAAAAALPALAACGARSASAPARAAADSAFRHGVASGDPLADRVMLWTRVTPAAPQTVPVEWRVYEDAQFTRLVASGEGSTDESNDYTFKVDVAGLAASTTYYYSFSALGEASPAGRTRALPSAGAQHLRLAVVSCSSYGHGYFNVYKTLARRTDLDTVIHLGDYIYESSGPDVRLHEPDKETTTLAVTPSISSAGDPKESDDAEELIEQLVVRNPDLLRAGNPHLKYVRGGLNGYLLVDVDDARLRAEYWLVPSVGAPTDEETLEQAFEVRDGVARLADSALA